MSKPGDLTKSGLLYEGSDFEHWKECTLVVFRAQGLHDEIAENCWCDNDGPDEDDQRTADKQPACNIMLARTFVHLRKRIPETYLRCPSHLLHALKKLAQPFRFLTLPAELRNQVYEHTVERGLKIKCSRAEDRVRGMHPLTASCRQIRTEVMPIQYSSSVLVIGLRAGWLPDGDRANAVEQCITRLDKMHFRHLRHATVELYFVSRTGSGPENKQDILDLHLTLVDDELHARVEPRFNSGRLTRASIKALQEHVAQTDRIRKLLSLQGEGIVLALTRDLGLWDVKFWSLK